LPRGVQTVGEAGDRPVAAAIYTGMATCDVAAMIELLRTNDAVVLSFVQSLLRDADIDCLVADENMSILDGSIGILPRRVLVADDDADAARQLLTDAGIGGEIRREP